MDVRIGESSTSPILTYTHTNRLFACSQSEAVLSNTAYVLDLWQHMYSMARGMGAVHPSLNGYKSGFHRLTCMYLAQVVCMLCRAFKDKSCI